MEEVPGKLVLSLQPRWAAREFWPGGGHQAFGGAGLPGEGALTSYSFISDVFTM